MVSNEVWIDIDVEALRDKAGRSSQPQLGARGLGSPVKLFYDPTKRATGRLLYCRVSGPPGQAVERDQTK